MEKLDIEPSPPMLGLRPVKEDIMSDIRCAAGSDVTVLITARSATDRRRHARFIHECSSRRQGPFVELSCGENEQGAAPPVSQLARSIESTRGGTIVLDKIDRLSPQLQAQLLSVLENGGQRDVDPNGDVSPREVRLIVGASRLLGADVVAERFSPVLFYRLNVIHIQIPDLMYMSPR